MGLVKCLCSGKCHCCCETSECFDLKEGKDAVEEGKQPEGNKSEYQDGDGTWEASEAGCGDSYE